MRLHCWTVMNGTEGRLEMEAEPVAAATADLQDCPIFSADGVAWGTCPSAHDESRALSCMTASVCSSLEQELQGKALQAAPMPLPMWAH